jgi:hypothetical protein
MLVVGFTTFAQVPNKISYQGLLITSSGAPATDGSYNLRFDIYNESTAGTLRYTQTSSGVDVSKGVYNVVLGPLPAIFNEPLFVELTVLAGSPEVTSDITFSPRVELTSVPFSLQSTSLMGPDCIIGVGAIAGGVANTASGEKSMIGGGTGNVAGGEKSFIGGGWNNEANGRYATIGGGTNNKSNNEHSSVLGGYGNKATGTLTTIGGGWFNQASANSATISGGENSLASGEHSAIGGGLFNEATGTFSTIGGGRMNHALAEHSTVGGGFYNWATTDRATASGGGGNHALGFASTIPGGQDNSAEGAYSFAAGHRGKAVHPGAFVWADSTDADFSSTGYNQFLIRAGGGVGIGTNSPTQQLQVHGVIYSDSGGFKFPDGTVQTTASTSGGGSYLPLSGGTMTGDIEGPGIRIGTGNFGIDNTVWAANFVAGVNNTAIYQYTAVVGGQWNTASGATSGILSGTNNNASGENSSVVGGNFNVASGFMASVIGGQVNHATGHETFIGGGEGNEASGFRSAVVGGVNNTAVGSFSFAAGHSAKANHNGSFVWADSTDADFASTGENQFIIRASGGVGIGTTTPHEQLEINGNLRLPRSTATSGIIKLGESNFIHDFGTYNTFVGDEVANLTMTGVSNTSIGANSFTNNISGGNNSALGARALSGNQVGSDNTAIGTDACAQNIDGNFNISLGSGALYYNQSGWNNTAIGFNAGADALGSGNVFLGFKAGFYETGSNRLYIANNDANTLIYGNFDSRQVGINQTAPTASLDVTGTTGYNQLRVRTSYTPTGSSDTNGNVGDIAWDANYLYVKTVAGWKRTALSTW